MQNFRQALRGIVIVLASIIFLFGGLSLSLVEGNMTAPIPTLPPTLSPTWPVFTSPANSPTPLPPTRTSTLPPPPTSCPPPAGWLPYVVLPGDTLEQLAKFYNISSTELGQANCLLTTGLLPGVVIYVPAVSTQTPVPCGPPASWVVYIVQPGDTLYRLSQAFGISVPQLQRANCMSGSLIRTGQKLYVPPWATRTPTRTLPSNPTETITTPFLPVETNTPMATFTPTATDTPIITETATSTFTPSPTATTPSP